MVRLLRDRRVWAIADQGVVSLANFGINVGIGRWLAETDYGAFASALAVFVMFQMVHASGFIEPMLVVGTRKHRSRLRDYRSVLLRFHGRLAVGIAALCGFGALVFWARGAHPLAEAMLGVGIAAYSVLLFYLYRKMCYMVDRSGLAAVAGTTYLILMAAGLLVLRLSDGLSLVSAYAVMGFAAAMAAALLHWKMPVGESVPGAKDAISGEVLRDHASYGKWALGAAVMVWFPPNIYYLVLPYTTGLAATGELRAVMNLLMPLLQANIAIAAVLLPRLAESRGDRRFHDVISRFTKGIVLSCVAYWAIMVGTAEPIMSALYGGRYTGSSGLIWILGALPLVSGLALARRTALQALERPDVVFRVSVAAAIFSGTFGVYLTWRFDLAGAALAMVLSYAVLWFLTETAWRRALASAVGPPHQHSARD